MAPDQSDPAQTLEAKLDDFAATLPDDELRVLHDVVHLAYEGGEVHGFAMPKLPAGMATCPCPCQGGEVTFPGTFAMLANLHITLHRRPTR